MMFVTQNLRRPLLGFALITLTGWVFAATAGADELPLVLSNDSIGMTGSEIEASQAPVEAPAVPQGAQASGEPLVLEAPTQNETTGTGSEFRQAPEPESDSANAAEPAAQNCATAAAAAGGIGSFGACVEGSIRGGVGFEESSKVCRALFPEKS